MTPMDREKGYLAFKEAVSRGRPSNERARQTAEAWLEILRGCPLPEPHVGVGRDGGVFLSLRREHRVAHFSCDADGDIVLCLVDYGDMNRDVEAEIIESHSFESVRAVLERVVGFLSV
jgi:hypothetical protein